MRRYNIGVKITLWIHRILSFARGRVCTCEWMYFVSFIHIPPQINTTFVLIINIVGIFFHFVGCLFIVLCLRFCFVLFRFVLLVCTVPSTRIGYSLLISIHWIHCYFPPMQFCLRMQSPIAIMCYTTQNPFTSLKLSKEQ